jgi:hypothetical protein
MEKSFLSLETQQSQLTLLKSCIRLMVLRSWKVDRWVVMLGLEA